MKKQFLLCLLAVAFGWQLNAQQFGCGTMDATAKKRAADPAYNQQMIQAEQDHLNYVNSGQSKVSSASRAVRTIPVVFHVIYNTTAENISTTLVQQALDQLNQDYRKLNTDLSSARSTVRSLAADAQIEFCLAQQTPSGASTTGIERTFTSKTCWDRQTETDDMKSASTGGANPWDPFRYLNIYVVRICGNNCQTGGNSGYAYLPTPGMHGNAIDGIVLDYCLAFAPGRRALTHEVGHYLGLRHTWGDLPDNACGSTTNGTFPDTDDGFQDTPNSKEPHYSCSASSSCPGQPSYGDLFEDFMDYSNCAYLFTTEQVNSMNSVLTNTRSSLLNTNKCTAVGGPIANFTASPTSICPGQSVTFTNSSTGSGNSYSWTFTGGTPSTSTATNPVVTYNAAGTYSVTLVATNSQGNNTKTQTNLITVAGSTALPLVEGFEGTFPPTGWQLNNPDNSTTWQKTTSASGFGTSSACAYINDYSYDAVGQTDMLITPAYNFTNVSAGRLRWEYAYRHYTDPTYHDTLDIMYSTNCGSTWTSLWKKGGSQLNTASSSTTSSFLPTSSQWKRDSVSLAALNGQSSVRFGFKSINRYGNNIFLDNINVFNSVTVVQAPVADFIGTPTTVVAGNTVSFTDISANAPTGWSWTFAGGTPGTSTSQNPVITYNTPGTYNVTLLATNSAGNNSITKTGYITVVQSGGGQTCDTLDNTLPGDTFVMFTTTGGYVAGNNPYSTAHAEFFANSQTRQVTGAYFLFAAAAVNGTGTFTAAVYDNSGSGGKPGTTPLATVNVNLSTAVSDVNNGLPTFVSFPTAPTVTGNFYVGVIHPTGLGDTIALATTTAGSPSSGEGWERTLTGVWEPYTTYWGLDISNLIFPVVCTSTGSAPTANFTSNKTALCPGGAVSFTSTSTGSPTSYSWSFVGGTPSVSTAQNPTVTYNNPGAYSVSLTVSNANGNHTINRSFYMTVYSKPSVAASSNPVLCFGASTGSAAAAASGGTPGYTYAWTGGGNTSSISAKPAGTYNVTVTDTRTCSASTSVNISQPLSALAASASSSSAICGLANGSLFAAGSGGAGGYTFLWNTNANTATVSNVGPGTYQVTVTDVNGCIASATTSVNNSNSNLAVGITVENTTCGLNNGSLLALPNGGAFDMTYQWNNGANTAAVSSLAPGIYTVTVTNLAGCTATASAVVGATSTAVNVTFSVTPAGCAQSNGTIIPSVNGGSGIYTYSWSDSSTSATLTNVAAGNYSLTVNDNQGCSATQSGTVSNTNAPTISFSSQNPVAGGNNGSVTAIVSGGTAPYQFLWNTGGNVATIANLPAGTYTVTITDNSGCVTISSTTLTGVVGIAQVKDIVSMNVYPNPAKDVFNIQLQLSKIHSLDLEIFNQLGQKVWAKHIAAFREGVETVDVGKLPGGVYYLKINAGGNVETVRVVKE